jgi:hypothetical protein
MSIQYRETNKYYNNQYTTLKNESYFECNVPSLCKNLHDRSEYDKKQYTSIVDKKPMNFPGKLNSNSWNKVKSHGLSLDPKNPIYDPIGGIGGTGWL